MALDVIQLRSSMISYDTEYESSYKIEVPTPEDIVLMKSSIKPIKTSTSASRKKSDMQKELDDLMQENENLDKQIEDEILDIYNKNLKIMKYRKEKTEFDIHGAYDRFHKRCKNGKTLFKIFDTEINYIVNYIKTNKPFAKLTMCECDTSEIAELAISDEPKAKKKFVETFTPLVKDVSKIH